jgi:cytidylate kinase
MIIAIDGPAGAGKSTIARELARRLGFLYIDTGAMYRAIAWKVLKKGVSLDDAGLIGEIADDAYIDLIGTVDAMEVFIDSVNITGEIRTLEMSQAASIVSTIPAVRHALVARQREMGREANVVMEGRDIGTVVFPNAEAKFYLDATTEARARRRFTEDLAQGRAVKSLEEMQTEIAARDYRDQTRSDSPLRRTDDAIYIDSSEETADQVIEKILSIIESKTASV